MNVEYCQICKTRLSERDFETQKAYWLDKRPFCRACATGNAKAAPAASSIPAKQPSSGIRPKIQTHADFVESLESMPGRPGSGLNKAPGSGTNKSPGSGTRPATASGILRASTTKPGSGIMMAHGTSLSPGSGLNKSVGSGIRTASNAAPTGKTSGLHKSTGSGIRSASPAGTAQRATGVRPPSGGNKGKPEGSGSGAPRPGARRRLTIRNPETGKFSWLPVVGCLIAIGIVIELILLMRR